MKILRIKKSSEFQKISKDGAKFHAKSLLLLSYPSPKQYYFDKKSAKNAENFLRLGFTVSKMVGGAVVRNRVKRKLKEAAKKLFLEYGKNHYDYVIIAKKQASKADFAMIIDDIKFCLKRIEYLKIDEVLEKPQNEENQAPKD